MVTTILCRCVDIDKDIFLKFYEEAFQGKDDGEFDDTLGRCARRTVARPPSHTRIHSSTHYLLLH